jgi:hypothetical protein
VAEPTRRHAPRLWHVCIRPHSISPIPCKPTGSGLPQLKREVAPKAGRIHGSRQPSFIMRPPSSRARQEDLLSTLPARATHGAHQQAVMSQQHDPRRDEALMRRRMQNRTSQRRFRGWSAAPGSAATTGSLSAHARPLCAVCSLRMPLPIVRTSHPVPSRRAHIPNTHLHFLPSRSPCANQTGLHF